MNFPKFSLKEDWYIESKFLNQLTKELVFEKGHTFESENGVYEIIWSGGKMSLTEEMMRDTKDKYQNFLFEEMNTDIKEEVIMTIEEIPESEEYEVKNWRIQLDVKTTRSKLREVEKIINEIVKPIL
jgi:hypothetical protein